MSKDLYSIVEVAELLGLHVKTVRNYIHEGRLRSTRLGKQFRIARADLDAFTGGALTKEQAIRLPVETEVSSVVEVNGVNMANAQRIANVIMAVVKDRNESQTLKIQTVHYEASARLKVIILGSLATTAALLGLIEQLAQDTTALA